MRPTISALEVRKREFARRFRGYDGDEVRQFLEALAEDLEELFRTLDELERENARLGEENARHRETEATLKETLVMAQRSAESLRATSEMEAEQVLHDAEQKGDALVRQAMERVAEMERAIRELRVERKNFHLKLQGMIDMFQQVLILDRQEDEQDKSVSLYRPRKREGDGG
ncbi:MAG: DivIVA domain-containing protein [Acidithiobacillales bacterium]